MFLYDLSNPNKEKGLHKYFKKIGEPPVIFDSYQTRKSAENLKLYLDQNGYFNSVVIDSVKNKRKRKVVSVYHVIPGKPYRINQFKHDIEDTNIQKIIFEDIDNSLVKTGNRFKVSDLIGEKKRVQIELLNNGYFDFSNEDTKNYITYSVDTSLNKMVNVTMSLRNPDLVSDGMTKHYKYRIGDVYVFRNYQPRDFINDPYYLSRDVDSIYYDSIIFLSKKGVKTKPGILSQSIYLLPNELYSQQNEYLTNKHLRSLRIFQNVEIDFKELGDSISLRNEKLMNCYINLTPLMRQFYQIEASVTNSPLSNRGETFIGDLGAEMFLKYQYKNLLGNAEILDVSLRGAGESLFFIPDSVKNNPDSLRSNAVSFGIETRLHIPKFLMPLKTERFIKKYSPQTSIALSYRYYERLNLYKKNDAYMSFGYNWIGNKYTRHMIDPFRINFVDVDTARGFGESVSADYSYLFESFRDKMITTTDYSFEYNNKGKRGSRDFIYFRYNLELGGNVLSNIYKLLFFTGCYEFR